jgi:hypothetical protein
MVYFCGYSMGIFISILLSFGLKHTQTLADWSVVLKTCVSVAFGASALAFLKLLKLKAEQAIVAYPVGLVIPLLWWFYENFGMEYLLSSDGFKKTIGIGWLLLAFAITGGPLFAFGKKAYSELFAAESPNPPA